MKKLIFAFLFFSCVAKAQFFKNDHVFAHTFSIVAIDKEHGEMAVAVQSHWFGVGNVVAWAEAGVGAVATQSFVNKSFGIRGLEMIKNGKTAQETLDLLLADDAGREVRQVGIVDKEGNLSVYTGTKCVDFAGHRKGMDYCVQSNMMLTDKVPDAMAEAFENNTKLPIAERVLKSLEAAQRAGGDIRGKQSAAIRVVKLKAGKEPWNDNYVVDLRVDDHINPIGEIARLLKVQRAYEHMNAGDLAVELNDMSKAMNEYKMAMDMFPENLEMKYWTAITLANNGDIMKAEKMLRSIYSKDKNWRELTKRLPKVGLLNVKDVELEKLTK